MQTNDSFVKPGSEHPDFKSGGRGTYRKQLTEVNNPSSRFANSSGVNSPTKSIALAVLFLFIKILFRMFYTYILYSESVDKFYIGVTENLKQRLIKHNNKNKGFTNQANDWTIVFSKDFELKSDALKLDQLSWVEFRQTFHRN